MTFLDSVKKLEEHLRKQGWTPEKDFTYPKAQALKGLPEYIQKHIVQKGMTLRQVQKEAHKIRSVLESAEHVPEAEKERILREIEENLDAILNQGLTYFRKKQNSQNMQRT